MNFEEAETPPRAWGRLSLPGVNKKPYRNTPTCVGKTASHSRIQAMMEKHPHVRGEDRWREGRRRRTWETPPRAWGRQEEGKKARAGTRNTPTCVGKTNAT